MISLQKIGNVCVLYIRFYCLTCWFSFKKFKITFTFYYGNFLGNGKSCNFFAFEQGRSYFIHTVKWSLLDESDLVVSIKSCKYKVWSKTCTIKYTYLISLKILILEGHAHCIFGSLSMLSLSLSLSLSLYSLSLSLSLSVFSFFGYISMEISSCFSITVYLSVYWQTSNKSDSVSNTYLQAVPRP